MAERRIDDDLRERLDEIERRLGAQIDRLMKRTFWLLAAIVVVLLVGGGSSAYLQASSSEQNDLRASETRQAVQEIQKQRVFSIRSGCKETNRRHRRTIATLDRVLAKARRTAPPSRRRVIAASRASTVLLIDAMLPVKDCAAVVARLAAPVG